MYSRAVCVFAQLGAAGLAYFSVFYFLLVGCVKECCTLNWKAVCPIPTTQLLKVQNVPFNIIGCSIVYCIYGATFAVVNQREIFSFLVEDKLFQIILILCPCMHYSKQLPLQKMIFFCSCAISLSVFPGDDFSIIQQEIFMVKECMHHNIVAYFGSYLW